MAPPKGKGKAKAAAATPAPAAASTSSSSKKSSKTAAAPKKPADDDFIVFTNSTKDKPKTKKSEQVAGTAEQVEPGVTGPPKPTVKQIIGGASWTGKLPVNLLSEHCQKQKWNRPDYQPVSVP